MASLVIVWKTLTVLLFVVSSGLWFSSWGKRHKGALILSGLFAVASTIFTAQKIWGDLLFDYLPFVEQESVEITVGDKISDAQKFSHIDAINYFNSELQSAIALRDSEQYTEAEKRFLSLEEFVIEQFGDVSCHIPAGSMAVS